MFLNFVRFLLDKKFSHGSYFIFCSVAPKLSKNIIFESFEGAGSTTLTLIESDTLDFSSSKKGIGNV